jgi:non-ribosomal peptide synthetase component E (peptide arylation enzyme)
MLVTDHSNARHILEVTFPGTVGNVCSGAVCVNEQRCLAQFQKLNRHKVTRTSLGVTALFLYSAGKCALGIANNKDVFNVSVRR